MQEQYELQMKARILKDLELRKERKEKLKEIEAKIIKKYEENESLFTGVDNEIDYFNLHNTDIMIAIDNQRQLREAKIVPGDASELFNDKAIFSVALDTLTKKATNSKVETSLNSHFLDLGLDKNRIIKITNYLNRVSIDTHIKKLWSEHDYYYRIDQMFQSFIEKSKLNKASMILEDFNEKEITHKDLHILLQIKKLEDERSKYRLLLCDSSHILTYWNGEHYCPTCKHKEGDIEKIDKTGRLIINNNTEWFHIFKRDKILSRMYKLHYITNFIHVDSYQNGFADIVNNSILEGKDAYQISRVLHKRYNINMFTYKG